MNFGFIKHLKQIQMGQILHYHSKICRLKQRNLICLGFDENTGEYISTTAFDKVINVEECSLGYSKTE